MADVGILRQALNFIGNQVVGPVQDAGQRAFDAVLQNPIAAVGGIAAGAGYAAANLMDLAANYYNGGDRQAAADTLESVIRAESQSATQTFGALSASMQGVQVPPAMVEANARSILTAQQSLVAAEQAIALVRQPSSTVVDFERAAQSVSNAANQIEKAVQVASASSRAASVKSAHASFAKPRSSRSHRTTSSRSSRSKQSRSDRSGVLESSSLYEKHHSTKKRVLSKPKSKSRSAPAGRPKRPRRAATRGYKR